MPIHISEIEVVTDASKGYEIISRVGIDFDNATFSNVNSITGSFFQPPPED